MTGNLSGSGGAGLEQSCVGGASDWLYRTEAVGGVELFEARLRRFAYRRHRHDTYAIGLTESGVQAFSYRGATHVSTPGQVVVLHPDERHDDHAGTDAGFRYRQLYIVPSVILEATRALRSRACALPFVRQPVGTNPILAAAIRSAFRYDREPLVIGDLMVRVAAELLSADPGSQCPARSQRANLVAINWVRQFLEAETTRVVNSWELEALTGLTRYELARQFRTIMGTSPYRYSLMRRLARARARVAERQPLAQVAVETGFADQAHFTRTFTAALGMTPGQYGALTSQERR